MSRQRASVEGSGNSRPIGVLADSLDQLIDYWDTSLAHTAPAGDFSVAQAHQVMQDHLECLREKCPRKQAAWDVLIAAKRIVPDTSRTR